MKHQSLIIGVLPLTAALRVSGQPGSLDKSFDGNGLLRTLLGSSCTANDVKVQSNGKIVVAGEYENSQNKTNFLVERYNIDGSFDNSFAGGDGQQGIDLGDYSEADAVAIQADGKIVAAGYRNIIGVGACYVVVRLNTNGTADNSFGAGGKLFLTSVASQGPASITIQPDGKIVVSGTTFAPGGSSLVIFRLNGNNGSFDTNFGTNGIQTMTLASGQYSQNVHAVVQSDGKIVLCCTQVTIFVDHSLYHAAIIRLNSNGTPDIQWGSNGVLLETVGSTDNPTGAASIALQADQKIVVGGYYLAPSGEFNFLVMRFNTNSTLDNTFAGNGRAGISFGHASANVMGIAVQSSGIIAGGLIHSEADADFGLVRLLSDGTPDTHFGSAGTGKVTTGFGYYDYPSAITLQPDGKILEVGASGNDMALARYLVTIALPPPPAPAAMQTTVSKMAGLQPVLYPNPANGSVQLTGLDPQSITRYSITDAAGKTHLSSSVAFAVTAQINTAQLPPGVYFIQLKTNNKTTTLRMVKE